MFFHGGGEGGEFDGTDHAAAAFDGVGGAGVGVGVAGGGGGAHEGDAAVGVVEAHGVELEELGAGHGIGEALEGG